MSTVMPSMTVSCGWVPCSTTSAWMPGAVSVMTGGKSPAGELIINAGKGDLSSGISRPVSGTWTSPR